MSNSNDTSELDNYGVWVKKPPKDIPLDNSETQGDFDIGSDITETDSLDSDIFETEQDIPQEVSSDDFDISVDGITEETLEDPFADVDFGENQASSEETPAETEDTVAEDDFNLDDITSDLNLDDISIDDDTTEETSVEEPVIEETAAEEPVLEETVLEETVSDEPAAGEPVIEESASEEISLDDIEDGEVDLDSFLSDDSSSDSTEEIDVSSEFDLGDSGDSSVDIGDFLGDSDFSTPEKKTEEIVEEDPLDIKLSFDESADSFETEDANTESSESEATAESSDRSTGEDLNTESIDISDFGVGDEDEGITGPEDAINEPKVDVVDYDMKVVADDDDDTSVSLSDVISGNVESDNSETDYTPETETVVQQDAEISQKGAEILQQIVGELASLKDEIKNLKTDFAQIKAHGPDLNIAPAAEEENTGFFADDDEDDTIALSGDELDNILNNAEFTDETSETISPEITEEPVTQSEGQFTSTIDESAFEDSSIFDDNDDDELTIEEPAPEISEDLPEEIEIPKIDEPSDPTIVEESSEGSSSEEFSSDPIDEIFKDDSVDSTLTSEKIDYISEDSNNTVSVDDELADLDLPSPSLDENFEVEPEVEDTVEEPVIEETAVEEPAMEDLNDETEDAPATEPVIEEAETSNPVSQAVSNEEIPGDLKSEIKSVLSYMDQLLENLPEDKISEFAQSEHFVTYKKLFQELGLS